ncbi:hypothetical protein [Noviherbaspirillum aerium]|uniref:hypothetical protein n=1 Tax=Noviherbaspirillum aerium TaxID=2588497 RepID=UPI00124F765C|nr:hypothetical protein [Noviherbaspirillum aerium]
MTGKALHPFPPTAMFRRSASLFAAVWIMAVFLLALAVPQVLATQPTKAGPGHRPERLQKVESAGERFACGGQVEQQTWELWDGSIRDWARKSVSDRLRREGDVYVLYDVQTYLHNLVSMARRCKRIDRLMEIASVVRPAYESLEPGGWFSPGRRWVCRGGRTCSGRPGLLGQEVQLVSLQFLGLASSIANALATTQIPAKNPAQNSAQGSSQFSLNEDAHAFIRTTSIVIAEHMLRWGDRKAIGKLADAAGASPEDVNTRSSDLLFTDKPLWMIGIYAEWAGILGDRDEGVKWHRLEGQEREALAKHVHVLLRLFNARLSYRTARQANGNGHGEAMPIAELDRGFWRHYSDHLYAGYEGSEKPLVCPEKGKSSRKGSESTTAPLHRIEAASVPKRPDVGWDLSHARRLVHVLDALERNREAMSGIFELAEKELPPGDLDVRFANALVTLSWNGDRQQPLFSNYLNGANGWYRVGYAAAGSCNEGTPPFGLSEAFVTGGYAAWSGQQAVIRQLGRRLHQLAILGEKQDGGQDSARERTPDRPRDGAQHKELIARYYPAFSRSAPPMGKALSKVMFLPSLVGVADE